MPDGAPVIPQLMQVVPPNVAPLQPQLVHEHAPAQPCLAEPARFQTPAGHYSNPVDNVLAATQNLAAIPITGNSPVEIEARNAIEMLKTAVTQQANYSYSQQRLHSTPRPSHNRSRHAESPAVSSSARWQRGQQQHDPPRPAISDAQAIINAARAMREAEARNIGVMNLNPPQPSLHHGKQVPPVGPLEYHACHPPYAMSACRLTSKVLARSQITRPISSRRHGLKALS